MSLNSKQGVGHRRGPLRPGPPRLPADVGDGDVVDTATLASVLGDIRRERNVGAGYMPTGVRRPVPPGGPTPPVANSSTGTAERPASGAGNAARPVKPSIAGGASGGSRGGKLNAAAARRRADPNDSPDECGEALASAGGSLSASLRAAGVSEADGADLLTSMCERLRVLERQQMRYQQEIKDLRGRQGQLQVSLQGKDDELDRRTRERDILAGRLAEMNAFLADYGLKFVGGESTPESGRGGGTAQDGPVLNSPSRAGTPGVKKRAAEAALRAAAAVTGSEDKETDSPGFDLYAGDINAAAAGSSARLDDAAAQKSGRTPQPGAPGAPLSRKPGEAASSALAALEASTPPTAAPSGQPEAEFVDNTPGLPLNLDLLCKRAEALSSHVAGTDVVITGGNGDDGSHHSGGIKRAVLRERESVFCTVYSDGISVNGGLFRPYGWPLCDAFINDIIEGFYPYEFKDKFPAGFPIEIVDKHREPCPRVAEPQGINGVANQQAPGYKPLNRAALLSKVPQMYITAGGKIVNPRDGLEALMGPTAAAPMPGEGNRLGTKAESGSQSQKTNTYVPEAPAAARPNGVDHVVAATPAAAALVDEERAARVTAVLVRFPNGEKAVVHMFFEDTVATLRRELEQVAAAFFPFTEAKYELCSTYPRRTYSDHAVTMEAAGLIPNSTLVLRKL